MATSQKPNGYIPTDDEIRATLKKTKWGETYLTKFLHSAERNIQISYIKLKGHFEMLESIGDIFELASENIGYSDSNISSSVIALLFGRACGNYFAAIRLSSSGQLAESYVQLRACIEDALYAFNIHKEPMLAQVWLDRHKDDKARKNSKKSFSLKNILDKLEQIDKKLGQETAKHYEKCIDYGAHPNERSVFPNMDIIPNGKISLKLFNTSEGVFEGCLLMCVMCGLDAIKIFNLIYPDDFKKFNADQRIQNIQSQFNQIAPGVIIALRNSTTP
jgi:hypothetical protein